MWLIPPCFDWQTEDQCAFREDLKGNAPRSRVLELGEQLNERLAKGGHDIGGVEARESSNNLDGNLANRVDLVVEGNEERTNALSLREMSVELGVEAGDGCLSDSRICTAK